MSTLTADHAAFHGQVTFLSWKDSSAQGPRVNLALTDRDELEHFDKVTRRSAKRAGQLYKAVVAPDDRDQRGMELWFCGANWSHQDGARVSFAVTSEDLNYWRELTARDQNADHPTRLWLTLVQVDASGEPINQAKADRLEAAIAPAPEQPKGGPNSKQAAQLVRDPQFHQFLTQLFGQTTVVDADLADEWVKDVCGIQSKRQLDHEPQAWELFRAKVRRPFLEWLGVPA